MCGDQLFQLWPLMGKTVKIGTRGSPLALWQANWVKSFLESRSPSLNVELVIIKTKGDKILDVPLARVGGKGLFVKEIETAILEGRVDLAVHSMKDMPAEIPAGLTIGAVPVRENPFDVLISINHCRFKDLPTGARIGTSSLRRAAQLKHARPDLEIESLRGNLDTRVKKLATENLDGAILAAAGVIRLNLDMHISEYLETDMMLPAVGQGALCIEIRKNDPDIGELVAPMDDPPTRIAVTAERAFLKELEGGCQVPIAAHGVLSGDELVVEGMIAELDGSRILREKISTTYENSKSAGIKLAGMLCEKGGKDILDKLKAIFYDSENR